jgi:hypothetical protein
MQTGTFFLILLAAIVALLLALYHYVYKARHTRKFTILLTSLRFLSLFALFTLLINPKFTRESYSLVPANLVILNDNTSSMAGSGAAQLRVVSEELWSDESLRERFRVSRYSFGTRLVQADSLDFTEEATDLSSALASLNEIYAQSQTVMVVLTDGNQTLGQDYEYARAGQRLPVYPVAMGDTTRYEDLRIEQVNINRYTFLDNQFPVETYITYEGLSSVSTQLRIFVDGTLVHREALQFSPASGSIAVSSLLKAANVGVRNIRLSLAPLENERNTANNERTLAIEVVDEQTDVAIVSAKLHPDLGTLEKAIESNEQRNVHILRPDASQVEFEAADIFLLYQPGVTFSRVYDYIKKSGAGSFTITGPETDWDFLNNVQTSFQKEILGQEEEILPVLNPGFSLFDISDLDFKDYPPLEGELGEILITKSHETLILQKIRGVDMQEPLLAIINGSGQKEAVVFGENLWRWRMQNFKDQGNFNSFDALIGKIFLYLGNTKTNERFSIDYNPVFQGSNEARVRASFFDETFAFDPQASLLINVSGKDNGISREIPMLLMGNYYEADLSDLPAGNYTFTARVEGEDFSESGGFTILDFNVEQQLMATDFRKLGRLAQKTGGMLYFPTQTDALTEKLLTDDRFRPVQKSELIVVSLIDHLWLLAIIAASLTAEWFIRKYNGLT